MAMLVSIPATFAQAQVPDTFLAEPKPVRIGLNLGRDVDPFIIGIDGRNAATGPVRLAPPVIGPLLSVEGDVSTQAATRKPVELRANSCSGELPAGRSCAISLALPADIGAGRYTIDVMLPGAEGGQVGADHSDQRALVALACRAGHRHRRVRSARWSPTGAPQRGR